MSAQYLLRFDDICPHMNWRVWAKIEQLLLEKDIRPILAIVPNNHDPSLQVDPPVTDFWNRVQAWQARNWSIALHGYQHVYVNRRRGLVRLTPASEFAGLQRNVQEEKLRSALAIFERHGIRADCWVAPSHSFDWNTVDLLKEMGIKVISDGLWPRPHTARNGIMWVPQQLWAPLRPMPSGVWTVCYHHNSWCERDLTRFRHDLERFAPQITSLDDVLHRFAGRQLTLYDRSSAWFNLSWNHRARPALAHFLRRIKGSTALLRS